ncbi:hypothetical protein E3N88_12711 [Mikania micrantha]|uniref:Uncharacterized protein n=1 Tax=Mikania micrantha TaxID=192012 RepID=A0A5N6P856_9ASTR|nr:hypothetical protein E3N88_12711 [Mikania micrantha]
MAPKKARTTGGINNKNKAPVDPRKEGSVHTVRDETSGTHGHNHENEEARIERLVEARVIAALDPTGPGKRCIITSGTTPQIRTHVKANKPVTMQSAVDLASTVNDDILRAEQQKERVGSKRKFDGGQSEGKSGERRFEAPFTKKGKPNDDKRNDYKSKPTCKRCKKQHFG